MTAHRFRFFATGPATDGCVAVDRDDAQHLKVLRAGSDDIFDVVCVDGSLWSAALDRPGMLRLLKQIAPAPAPRPHVTLFAGVLSGQKWDALVDAAVQAGADTVVPVAASPREASAIDKRHERSERICRAAAKQAKRRSIPQIESAIQLDDVPGPGAGESAFVLDPGSEALVDALATGEKAPTAISIVVGAAAGLTDEQVALLVARGWQRAGMGPTILRSELAAPIAVSLVCQHLSR